MKTIRLGQDEFRVSVTPDEARILINVMNETVRELEDEFETRVGATIEEANAIISQLETAAR